MNISIQDILASLEPYDDKIVRSPMSHEELDNLEERVGLSIPTPLREYLSYIGLFQDLTHGRTSSIEMFETPAQFVQEREFLSEILKPSQPELFPFGHDGSGNIFALPSIPEEAWIIRFVNHETRKVLRRKDFAVWLQSIVSKVLKGIKKRPTNDLKRWCVQFAVGSISFAGLLELLSSVGEVKEIDQRWMNVQISRSKVTSTERRLELNGDVVRVKQLEYAGWDPPNQLFFDMEEPVMEAIEHSQIRLLHELFTEKCPGYKLVNYGPLTRRNEKE